MGFKCGNRRGRPVGEGKWFHRLENAQIRFQLDVQNGNKWSEDLWGYKNENQQRGLCYLMTINVHNNLVPFNNSVKSQHPHQMMSQTYTVHGHKGGNKEAAMFVLTPRAG